MDNQDKEEQSKAIIKEHLSRFRFLEPTNAEDASYLAGFWHIFFNDLLDDIEDKNESKTYWIQSRMEHLLGRCKGLCIYCGEIQDDV